MSEGITGSSCIHAEKQLRKKLEQELEQDLSGHKALIRLEVSLSSLLACPPPPLSGPRADNFHALQIEQYLDGQQQDSDANELREFSKDQEVEVEEEDQEEEDDQENEEEDEEEEEEEVTYIITLPQRSII